MADQQPNFEEIGEGLLSELNRRLGDSRSAERLPGTLLMQLAERYLRYMEKKQAAGIGEEENVVSILDVMELEIPLDDRYDILYEHYISLSDEMEAVEKLMNKCGEEYEKLKEAETNDPAPVP